MINLRHNTLLLILFGLPLLFGGCKGSDIGLSCDDSNTYKISQHAHDFFYFKEGTWWLYEQEGTGLTDSIWVSWSQRESDKSSKMKEECNCGHGKCAEGAGIRLQNRAHSGNDYLCHYVLGTSIDDGHTAITGETPNASLRYSPLRGFWVYSSENNIVDRTNSGLVFDSLDTMVVSGKIFREVLHQHVPSKNYRNDYLHDIWFARNFFVIRYKRFDNTYWNLADNNIVQ